MRIQFLILSLLWTLISSAQSYTFQGTVGDPENHEPLVGATVVIPNTTVGVVTNPDGEFSFEYSKPEATVIAKFVGYEPDTVQLSAGEFQHIRLSAGQELEEVVVKGDIAFIDEANPIQTEVITEKELLKAPCCNLSESFETNASVDVSFTDAVTGTRQINMLGLSGRYVQINRENIPQIRGLVSRYGLSFIPGTWIQAIDVGKGAGTVVNGYESMTGQINLEFKKPEISERLYLNTYINSFGRLEQNANVTADLGEKWSTALLVHADYFGNELDGNDDGFMDLPKSRQFNVLNRYKFRNERVATQLGFHFLTDDKAGGQLGFGFDDDASTSTQYGYESQTRHFEFFGKTGLLFPHKPNKGFGFIYSARFTDVDQQYGRRPYEGTEKSVYLNGIYQNIIGNTLHQYKAGISYLYDDYDEAWTDSTFARTEHVPGLFYEYSYLPTDDFSLVLGTRVDFHNLYGEFFSPRLHTRYQAAENTTLRFSVGKGYRVPNVMAEYGQFMVSSRQLNVRSELQPERSWNTGASVVQSFPVGNKDLKFTADYYYTRFENQVVMDLDQNPSQLMLYNLDGKSFAHSLQLEGSYPLTDRLKAKAAYKYYDVRTTMDGGRRQLPFISKHRGFLNIGYATRFDIWQVDATLQWYGPKRIPDTSDKPTALRARDQSPDFFRLNAQISKKYRWGTIYIGGENLLNFTQPVPVIDAESPFGPDFDASINWGPVPGRMVFVGYRFKME